MPIIKSWITSANSNSTHFPLNNLPYCVFSVADNEPRCGVGIGDQILDIATLESEGIVSINFEPVFNQPSWNSFMRLGNETWEVFRQRLTDLLSENGIPLVRENLELVKRILLPMKQCKLHMPFQVMEYTDFYAGRQHAFNVGSMFRGPENALPPNWLHIPIGYNGRASSVVVSGTDIHRPVGQIKPSDAEVPTFGPSNRLDFELELGAIVGESSKLGQPVTVAQADKMIFGYVLLNDWSARDIQAWEYQPLGPFQAKAFATTISPWIVTRSALEPFRCSTPKREVELLPYLQEPSPMLYDIALEVSLATTESNNSTVVSRTNYNTMYYSSAQQLCHHSISGCSMRVGDLLGTGTISGKDKNNFGSMLEITWGGKEPIKLDSGEERSFLEDGDRVTMTGFAKGDGFLVGFGSCEGKILPKVAMPFLEKD